MWSTSWHESHKLSTSTYTWQIVAKVLKNHNAFFQIIFEVLDCWIRWIIIENCHFVKNNCHRWIYHICDNLHKIWEWLLKNEPLFARFNRAIYSRQNIQDNEIISLAYYFRNSKVIPFEVKANCDNFKSLDQQKCLGQCNDTSNTFGKHTHITI